MKRIFTVLCLAVLFCVNAAAQKTVYIPNEWKNPWPSDSLLYKESDPDGKYTWSKTRSVESDNVIIFWDKYYKTNPKNLPKSDFYYVDIDDLLQKCEAFYDLEINKLGFVDPVNSNLSKYKVMVLMNHTTTWTCYGGGYDYQVSALWLNPSTCKPVGHSVAHEVGHSFHYMCYAEHSGHRDSQTDNTGFHLACGNGQAIWEQTAQWQANQSYPELMFDQSIGIFRNSHNYAYSHEWHRYQSYWFHYYLCQHYDDITTVAQVWNQPMTGQSRGNATDFNQALMALKGLSVRDLFKLYFDYACHCATWDFDVAAPYRDPYIGDLNYRCVMLGDCEYQVALASCPQGSGFNVIPLQVPEAGTQVTTHLTGLRMGASLQEADPGEYLNGDSQFQKAESRRYNSIASRSSRGFRMGYVALMQDGSRRYFSEDSVYCQGTSLVTEDYSFTVPEGVSRMWLVVSPALKTYNQHKWDDTIAADDMWPYSFRLEGTDVGSRATVYVSPTLDGREASNITLTYDVSFPRDAQGYSGTSVIVGGQAAAMLGTAFQLSLSDISSKMQTWQASGPSTGKIMFYGVNANGQLAQSGSTANGYGHWFNASGNVSDWGSGYVFSEFSGGALSFSLGQYPGRSANGSKYTIRQALRYRVSATQYAVATFVFNITVGGPASATLSNIDYTVPTAISTVAAQPADHRYFDLQGRPVSQPQKGLYIQNGRKVVIR